MLVSIFRTYGKGHFSTKIGRFSTTVPLPLLIILAGLLSLWVFIIPYVLPGFPFFGLITLFQFLSMALRLIYFPIHVLILSSNIFVRSLFKRVNEHLFIWCWTFSQNCSWLNKTHLEPLSWTLILWSFKERNSCKDFLSSVERLLRILL